MSDEHHAATQRRKIHEAITEILKLDPEYDRTNAFVKGWVLVIDLSGFTPADDKSVIEEVRGQPWAAIDVWSSDATGETDLPMHTAEGLLTYSGAHYEDIYDALPINNEDEEEEDDDGD